tara:strand:- start:223 stop:519 length:297 start_codon:yes stop_codon:yes gene_type:complete
MFNFAELNPENKVLRVVVGDDINWCEEHLGGRWIQVQKTENKNLPSIGWTYHPDKDNFSSPQPYPSWTLDENCDWQCPVPYPDDGKMYVWNHESQTWV